MSKLTRWLSLLLLALALPACASSRGPETGDMPRSRDPNRLSREEVLSSHTTDTYEVIRTLRPAWLRKRGALSVMQSSDIQVYLDNVQLGGLQMLRSVPANSVGSLQYLDASTATQRWGTGHVHGAILITTMTTQRSGVARPGARHHIGGAPAVRGLARD